jgi:hypothetical protein
MNLLWQGMEKDRGKTAAKTGKHPLGIYRPKACG